MVKAWARLLGSSSTRRIGLVALGTAVGHGAALLAMPLLTRLYEPASFGAFAWIFAVVSIVAPVAAWRLELGIPMAASDGEALDVLRTAMLATLATALLLAAAVVADRGGWLVAGAPAGAGPLVWAIPLIVMLGGASSAWTYWSARAGRFRAIAVSRSGQGMASALMQLACGVVAGSVGGLVAGDVAGRLVGLGALVGRAGGRCLALPRDWFARSRIVIGQYRRFPLLSAPAVLLNSLSLFLPLLVVGHVHGATASGLFLLAHRVVGLPSSLLVQAASQVYLSDFTGQAGARARRRLYRQSLLRLALLGGIPILALGLASYFAFGLVFGPEWVEAGAMALVLAPYFALQLLSGATIGTLEMLSRNDLRLWRESIFLLLTLASFGLTSVLGVGALASVAAYSACGTVFYGWSMFRVAAVLDAETVDDLR